MQSFDVVIAGGGIVGMALTAGLCRRGLHVALLERYPVEATLHTLLDDHSALRVSAINAASERLLQHLDVWDDIVALRASPYREMEVWDKDSCGKISFHADEYGFNHLGHIIENRVILQALLQQISQLANVTLLIPAIPKQIAWGENEAFITLSDERVLSTRLVIGADGANSWLRQHADIPQTFWHYGHSALVATIRNEVPHQSKARQIFHGEGILAFLPLSDPYQCSIVWSLPPLKATELAQMPVQQFNRELATTFDMRLGLCQLASERQIFPLIARYAHCFASHRLALVGDAAHTVHPLAGQGVNLGLIDVAELIDELNRLHRQGKDIGQYLYLRRYERRRKQSTALILAGMQGFRELFAANNPVSKWLRDMGLILADKLPVIKPKLLRQAMGLNDMPNWLDIDK